MPQAHPTWQLLPRVGEDPSTLLVWVGAPGLTSAPALRWKLGGQPAQPKPVLPLQSARTAGQVEGSDRARVFCGLYLFEGLKPETDYEVSVRGAGAKEGSLTTRTLPLSLMPAPDGSRAARGFNLLLASCYDQRSEGRPGLIDDRVRAMATLAGCAPDLTLLMGDQVYLDQPTEQDFRATRIWLGNKFEADYGRNWFGQTDQPNLTGLLRSAAALHLPDDHEYWNNYPHNSVIIQSSYHCRQRAAWVEVAERLYTSFQLTPPTQLGGCREMEIEPLSLFLADARSARHAHGSSRRGHHFMPNQGCAFGAGTVEALEKWVDGLIARGHYGVFVAGQSMFVPPTGCKGRLTDWELPNYDDYEPVMEQLLRASRPGRPLICVTGDVHYGRVVSASMVSDPTRKLYEVICSPLAKVRNPFDEVSGWFSGQPFPRHSDAEKPIPELTVDGHTVRCRLEHGQRGDQLALLRFAPRAGGRELAADVHFYPLHPKAKYQTPVRVPLF